MKKSVLLTASFFFSLNTWASTPPEAVDGIDTAREGNLSQLVVDYYKQNLKVDCGVNEVVKIDILKLTSQSSNDDKTPTTPYSYSAKYLVLQKCLYGSTFVGAYSDGKKAVEIEASFASAYDQTGGPAKMENLKIEFKKTIDQAVDSSN